MDGQWRGEEEVEGHAIPSPASPVPKTHHLPAMRFLSEALSLSPLIRHTALLQGPTKECSNRQKRQDRVGRGQTGEKDWEEGEKEGA